LGDHFNLLTGGSHTILPREQTLRAALDWSHDLLGEAERTLFNRLAIFAGSFSLESVEAICVHEIDNASPTHGIHPS
jgi:predicted ATPase